MAQQTTVILAEHVAEAVRRGREESGRSWKIAAIRHLRIATGAGLNEAKTLIERYETTGDCRTEDEQIRDRLAIAEATLEKLRDEMAAIRDIAYRAGAAGARDALEAIHSRAAQAAHEES